MELSIDRGLKSYDVKDADGALLGTVRLNLADPGLAGRWGEAERALQALMAQGAPRDAAALAQMDQAIKAQIDYAFAAPVSAVFFGGLSSLALCADGRLVLETVTDALLPLVQQAQQAAARASASRMEKYTAAYQGSAEGLAPGQQA